jgi:hypothetical protein
MTKTFIPLDDIAHQLAQEQHGDNTEDTATLILNRINAVPGCCTPQHAVVLLAEGINRRNIDALVAAGRIRLHDPITYAPTNEIRGALVDKDEVIGQIMSGEHVPLLKEAKDPPVLKMEVVTVTQPAPAAQIEAWRTKARIIGESIYKNKPALNIEQIAKKVHSEMTARHAKKEPNMTGRGGKVPSAASIKRHALNGLKS